MTVGSRIWLGFGLALALFTVVGVVSYRSIELLSTTSDSVAHSHQVLEHVSSLFGALKDAETGQRGFIITGDETYLEPFTQGSTTFPRLDSELRILLGDNTAQLQRLSEVEKYAGEKLTELRLTIDTRRSQGFEATQKIISNGRGKGFMDEARGVLAQMDQSERETLKRRTDDALESASHARWLILSMSFTSFVVVFLFAFWITSNLSKSVGSAVAHIQSSSSELQTAAAQQASGARESSQAMNEITTTINELLATSRQIAESAARVSQIAQETSQASKAGDITAQRTSESVGSIRKQVDQIVTHMLDLGRKSQQIGGILEIINELSEQTNILAINATIEAAGAGEAGKRFSVVAEEIRKLADRVGGSTKEIRSLIEEIRAAVNTTVMATESGSKAVDLGARQFGEVTQSLQQIAALVVTTAESAREIQLSTKQQSTAVEQVNLAVANVAKATRETESSATQTASTATQLSHLSRELNRLIRSENA